jgi:hypothetical protein
VLRGRVVAPLLVSALMAALSGPVVGAGGERLAEPVAAPSGSTVPAAAVATTRWSLRTSLGDRSFRSSLSRGRLDLGMAFEAPLRTARPGDFALDPVLAYAPALPAVSVGLRGVSAGTSPAAGSLIERATGAGASAESRLGLEWKPAPSRVFLNQGLGIRLDGDDRLTMRLRKGSLGIYLKTQF